MDSDSVLTLTVDELSDLLYDLIYDHVEDNGLTLPTSAISSMSQDLAWGLNDNVVVQTKPDGSGLSLERSTRSGIDSA